MRLQHGRSHALYRDLLQAATVTSILSGFRNVTQESRLAECVSGTTGAVASAIRMDDVGYYQSAE